LNTKKHYLKRTLCISSIMLTALIAGCNSSSDSSVSGNDSTKSSELTVIETNPVVDAEAAPLNHKVVATFSEAMDSTTIDTQSFSVKADGEQALSGNITVDAASHTASFTPVAPGFTAETLYTVTLTTAIKTKAGSVALANNYEWQFTSGKAADNAAPVVDSTNPVDTATKVAPNRAVTANFSEALDPATVKGSTFTLSYVSDGAKVSGDVSYSNKVATFTPSTNLTAGKEYTATLTTGITDAADNALAAKTWTFKTGINLAKGPEPVNLGTTGDFAILTEAGITDTDTHLSAITGDIGTSPISSSFIGVTCSEMTGTSTIYGSDAGYTGSGDTTCYTLAKTKVDNAVLDMHTAYTDAAGRTDNPVMNLGAGEIGGKTIYPGLYKWGTDVNITTNVTLSGDANDVWIFQVAGNLIQASAKIVTLAGDAQAKNVFWQVGEGVNLNTYAQFKGIVLAKTAITVKTGAKVNGRLLSQTAATLDENAITQPAQ
jgi:hypothetical protein